jgi:hypothetical protein
MAAGTAASAMNGGTSGGSGGTGGIPNFFSGGMGAAGRAVSQHVMNQAMNKNKATASATARGLSGGMGKRMGSIESRLDALEGGGESENSVQSVQPVQEITQGSSFGEVPSAPVAAGTLNASASPGSIQESMPSPGDPAADMFGTEFMRNASVGAAKMRTNKKI